MAERFGITAAEVAVMFVSATSGATTMFVATVVSALMIAIIIPISRMVPFLSIL